MCVIAVKPKSPSHAVGLERYLIDNWWAMPELSPSHTVGSELTKELFVYLQSCVVAIPHGGLRTRILANPEYVFHTVAIPPSGLGTVITNKFLLVFLLSPSHPVGSEHILEQKINSHPSSRHPTQWARNFIMYRRLLNSLAESPSHPVGSEPQTTTLTKIRHINHFVKGAPFSNEVNFPKSEIMQS